MRALGALHLHSTYSYDAKLSLTELKQLFRSHGLSFACMTEHTDEMTPVAAEAFIAECRALSDDTFVFVPGFEISYRDTHILAPGCTTFVSQHATDAELATWREHAPLMILAHPHRNGYQNRAPEGMLDGVEVWNAQYDGKVVPRNGARALLARMRAVHHKLAAFAGWDFHREAHAGGPVIAADVDALSEQAIIAALKSGAYTLRSQVVEMHSDGTLLGADPRWVALLSSGYVHVIRTGKVINRVLAWFGLKLPKKLVAQIRGRL
jgi:predicted metal-dependent phosphoesterase TrpH